MQNGAMVVTPMGKVVVATPMRNAARFVKRWADQLATLQRPSQGLDVVVLEGDSTDETWEMVCEEARAGRTSMALRRWHHHGPVYGSIVHPQRFRQMARVLNTLLDAVDLSACDYVLVLPVDIAFEPDMLMRLMSHQVDIVAPLVFQNDRFYDTWAFSTYGENLRAFTKQELQSHLQTKEVGLWEMDTVGGTVLMTKAVLADGVRYSERDVDRGLCAMARARGYRIFADPWTWVDHG